MSTRHHRRRALDHLPKRRSRTRWSFRCRRRLDFPWEQLSSSRFTTDILVPSIDGQPRFLVEVKRGRLGAHVGQAAQYALER